MAEQGTVEKFVGLVFEITRLRNRRGEMISELRTIQRKADYETLLEIAARLKAEANEIMSAEEIKELNKPLAFPKPDDPLPDNPEGDFINFLDQMDRQSISEEFLSWAKDVIRTLKSRREHAEDRAKKKMQAPKASVTPFKR